MRRIRRIGADKVPWESAKSAKSVVYRIIQHHRGRQRAPSRGEKV